MFTIALPTADRSATDRFCRDVLQLEPIVDEIGDDGIAEPLQFRLGADAALMFIPPGGFGWVTQGRETAAPGVTECLLSLDVDRDEEVDAVAARAGASPERKPWGYLATFPDPDQHLWQVIHRS
jgi:uncharacterized protein